MIIFSKIAQSSRLCSSGLGVMTIASHAIGREFKSPLEYFAETPNFLLLSLFSDVAVMIGV